MNTSTILCPHCRLSISLDQALAHQLAAEQESIMAAKIAEAEANAARSAKALHDQELQGITAKMQGLEQEKQQKDRQLQEMAALELQLRQERNTIEARERTLVLEVQRQVDEERVKTRELIAKEEEEKHHFQMAQRDKTIDDMRRQLAEAQRTAAQGSQQAQGEVVELELEATLRRLFPLDLITPVGKGVNGADIVQSVQDRTGNSCGKIVWELKNTKAWSQGWVAKLKEDQRREGAEVAVLITSVLPEGVVTFGYVDGVWVGSLASVSGLATVLRGTLLQVSKVRGLSENKQEKMEVLYEHLTGLAFHQQVQSIVEAFIEMRDSLQREKIDYTKRWAVREKHLDRALLGMSGMWGNLEGLMGPALQRIDVLSLEDGVE